MPGSFLLLIGVFLGFAGFVYELIVLTNPYYFGHPLEYREDRRFGIYVMITAGFVFAIGCFLLF